MYLFIYYIYIFIYIIGIFIYLYYALISILKVVVQSFKKNYNVLKKIQISIILYKSPSTINLNTKSYLNQVNKRPSPHIIPNNPTHRPNQETFVTPSLKKKKLNKLKRSVKRNCRFGFQN